MTDRSGGRMKTKVKVANRDRLVRRAIMTALVLMALFATSLIGQQAPSQLTLEEAIGLAKANNPTFLSTQNDQAYAQFLPSLRAGVGGTWQAAGVQRFGTVEFAQNTDWLYSGYSLNFGMTIDGNTIFGIPNARANKRATGARITAAEFNLESTVALQYMAVLRGLDGVDVAQRQLDRAQQNLQIVNTRVSTGAAAGTEGKQAEVDLGRAEVTLIQAERDLRQARLLLSEQMGVMLDEDVQLLSEFEVFQPEFDVDDLWGIALAAHPSLNSFRSQESATRAAARQLSTSQCLPSVSLSASFRGQAQQALNEDYILGQEEGFAANRVGSCEFSNTLHYGLNGGLPDYAIQDCSTFQLTEEGRTAALAARGRSRPTI